MVQLFLCDASSLQPPPIGDDFSWPHDRLSICRNLRQNMFHITTESKNITTLKSHPTNHMHCASRRSPFPDAVGLVRMKTQPQRRMPQQAPQEGQQGVREEFCMHHAPQPEEDAPSTQGEHGRIILHATAATSY